MQHIITLLSTVFLSLTLLAQTPRINELMAVNLATVQDEDGEFEDWLELYNPSSIAASLSGHWLSDDRDNLQMWQLPSILLSSNDHLLIFASGKNRRTAAAHWETIIDWGDTWRYRIGDSEPPADWQIAGFDDSSWLEGPTGIGYGDDDDATIIAPTLSFYMRYSFTIDDLEAIRAVLFHVDYDDAYVAYLNGIEFSRANIGTPGDGPPAFDDIPHMYTEPLIASGGEPLSITVDDFPALLSEGENVLAIQVHNFLLTSSDMTIIPFLTLGFDAPPANANGLSADLTGLIPAIHTNFSISSSGETIYLSNSAGEVVDSITAPPISTDISYGRQPDGSDQLAYFDMPTPGDINSSSGYSTLAAAPVFSQEAGFYSSTISLDLTSSQADASIYYTLDGSAPDEISNLYSAPLNIAATSIVRARAYLPQALPSPIETRTFFMNEPRNLTTISIVSTPGNFFDHDSGIYASGPNASSNFPFFGANFWEDWERPIHLELFETDGSLGFEMNAGTKIFGGWSRGFAQKSLSVFARGEYGTSEIDYRLFAGKGIDSFQAFILRNSGNDWNGTMYRDAMLQTLTKNMDIDRQAYRPAVVFLNGEYWGIQNIREKLNEHYLASNHDVEATAVDLLEFDAQVIQGSATHYNNMLDYITNNDLADPVHFDYVLSQMDLSNFLDYQIANIYFDNTDWPGNNIKYWRPRTESGKWRWIMFDTDFGFGLWTLDSYLHNTLWFATEANGPAWPNPPWSTLLLREMLNSEAFEVAFINRFADRMNVDFEDVRVISVIDSIENLLENDIQRHLVRWGGGNLPDWNNRVQRMRDFAELRPAKMREFIVDYFALGGEVDVTLDASSEGGSIKLNVIHHRQFPWTGIYFRDVPISLVAIPDPGYQFIRWEGDISSTSPGQTILLNGDLSVTAVFEETPNSGEVVINEINYNSSNNFNPEDWIELLNDTGALIDLSGWQFKDEDDTHVFTIPAGTEIAADQFLVLCRDSTLFSAAFPEVSNYLGNFTFGLDGGGELLRLYDAQENLIDSLSYDDEMPWPLEPDGNGPTLALTNATLDNALGGSWATSEGFGSPGTANRIRVGIDDESADTIIPGAFHLYQNMPNPFNPATTIRFDISRKTKVQLDVYTILGQRVASLIDDDVDAGSHSIIWQPGQHISSGIYIYRLQTGTGFVQSRKLIYMK